MKNATFIKTEAKEQIIDLLREMDCYRFDEDGIDLWLDMWERANDKQITEIAEKSPYYDGKCKIVFPEKFPREFDVYGYYNFFNWLRNYANRNLTEVRFNNLSWKDLSVCYEVLDRYDALRNYRDDNDNMAIKGIMVMLDEDESIINNFTDSFERMRAKINNAYNDFSNMQRRSLVNVNGNFYYKEEYNNSPARVANILAEVLNAYDTLKTQFLTENGARVLKDHFPEIRFAKGQKLSKAVNAIATKYGLKQDSEWEKEFAKFANAVNPLEVVKWTVISWHPVDYLTFCFGNSWSSCHTIDKKNVRKIKLTNSRSSITNYIDPENGRFYGEKAAGALSYMFDSSSFIYYTVSNKYEGEHYEEQPKESRIVFALSDDYSTLLQGRVYPQCNDDSPDETPYRIPREIVQRVICNSLNVPNLWTIKRGSNACYDYVRSVGVHYPDWEDERNNKCNISYRGEQPKVINVGHDAICPNCGAVHTYVSSLNCYDCDPMN